MKTIQELKLESVIIRLEKLKKRLSPGVDTDEGLEQEIYLFMKRELSECIKTLKEIKKVVSSSQSDKI